MAIFMCAIWGIFCVATVFFTQKWYLPKLKLKTTGSDEYVISNKINHKVFIALLFGISIIIALICGFVSGNRQDELLSTIKMLLALCVLNVVAIIDIELYKIPNICVLILLAGKGLSIIPEIIINDGTVWIGLVNSIIAGTFSLVFLLLMSKITRGGIGYGDIKIFGSLGFLCGVRAVIYTLMISFFLSAVVSVVLLITKRKQLKDGLPMGPFIWIGFATTIVFGLC